MAFKPLATVCIKIKPFDYGTFSDEKLGVESRKERDNKEEIRKI